MAQSYRQLICWQKAMDAAVALYHLSAKWPNDERFGLTSQARRAAVSIPSNIAEGEGRGSKADFSRFCAIAYGSLQELETQILLSERLGFSAANDVVTLLDQCAEVGRLINGLSRHLDAKSSLTTDH